MWLRARSKTALCLSVASFLFTPAIAKHQETTAVRLPAHRVAVEHLTCDRSVIDPISYEMATVGQAQTLLSDSTLDDLNGDIQEPCDVPRTGGGRVLPSGSRVSKPVAQAGDHDSMEPGEKAAFR